MYVEKNGVLGGKLQKSETPQIKGACLVVVHMVSYRVLTEPLQAPHFPASLNSIAPFYDLFFFVTFVSFFFTFLVDWM